MLELVLFDVFIDFLDKGIECAFRVFSDNTELGGSADLLGNRKDLQKGKDISINTLRPYV